MRTGLVPVRLCDCGLSVLQFSLFFRPFRPRAPVGLRGDAEDMGPERTGIHRGTAASGEVQRPGESPASLRCVQALRGGVHGCPPAGEPPPRIGKQYPGPGDDTQQVADRSARPAPHTGADRFRRFGHPAL